HRLSSSYKHELSTYRPIAEKPRGLAAAAHPNAWIAAEQRMVAAEAKHYRRTLREGHPLGRIRIPRLGLNMLLVTGTTESSLEKGPGWYTRSYLPGEHQLMYVAGHRTTYLAPFAHIDSLRPGDR